MGKYLWMTVSDDSYELPEVTADTAEELAKKLGKKTNAIYSAVSHAEKEGRKCMYKRVPIIDDEEEI